MGVYRYGNVGKSDTGFEALRRLRLFLSTEEPGLIRVLLSMWHNQERAVTYKELREALLAGAIDVRHMEAWQQDYARFVIKILQPGWKKAIKTALEAVQASIPEQDFSVWGDIDSFTQERSGYFVTQCTQVQRESINALIERAAILQDVTAVELSQVIRPLVGLTRQQSETNFRLYEKLRTEGRRHKTAMDQCARLAGRQHRYRAMNIARTEMAWAYNKGEYEAVRRAQREGYLGQLKKVWCTADDERVCSICGGMDKQEFAMEESINFPDRMLWDGFMLAPPAHCSCRCSILYEEVSPPYGGGKGR